MKTYNKENFQFSLLSTDWNNVLLSDNVNEAWHNLKTIFLSVLDSIAPVKQIKVKQRSEPWIHSEVLQCIQERNNVFFTYKHDRSDCYYENLNLSEIKHNMHSRKLRKIILLRHVESKRLILNLYGYGRGRPPKLLL